AVKVRQEDQTRLVVAGGGRKDVARQRHGRRERVLVAAQIPVVERGERGRGGGRDRVEDTEQRVAVAVRVAPDERGVVVVIARIHPHTRRQPAAHAHFALGVKKRYLDAINLAGVLGDDGEAHVHGRVTVAVAPIP